MLHAKDLMIGDYLRINRDGLCIKKGTVVEVRGIDADDKLIEKGLIGSTHCRPLDKEQFDGGIWCDYLDPIPLTPEILEKNGFEKQAFDGWEYDIRSKSGGDLVGLVLWRCDSLSPHLRIEKFTRNYGRFTSFGINYVHELQHALRLCGIEKEIIL